ncbi:MAG: 2-oxoglutarate dehydrogenase E1 component [Spirochaetes bacterium]|nr:2-oxoglutarate dehydrogenase E1 component [Spirochaetota bacterium]
MQSKPGDAYGSALSADQAYFLEDLYNKFRNEPQTMTSDWRDFFRDIESNGASHGIQRANGGVQNDELTLGAGIDISLLKEMGVQNLLNAYRSRGHLAAHLDPLGILKPNRAGIEDRLNNLTRDDLESEFDTEVPGLGVAKLKDVVAWFEKTYCASIGAEHYYLRNAQERIWLQYKMEVSANSATLSKEQQLRIFEKLYQADYFEKFLGKKFVGKKRFSLEGGDALIPMLDAAVEQSGAMGMNGIVIGMAHRGRLNVLENIMQKPAQFIFAEFKEKADVLTYDNADVKYHLGYSAEHITSSGKKVHLTLMFNPSHLEAVNPVCLGSVRARQTLNSDNAREKYMGILIHGDAAFIGQGVVPETFNLMNIPGYTTGGTLHIVINNQIGFTTTPEEARSTGYATDLAKGFQVPIFHVNGDDPEACHRVISLAMEYKQRYKKDVVIDLVCYRRHGHNETDEPAFTQPTMYDIIRKHPTPVDIYEKRLVAGGVAAAELEAIKNKVNETLDKSFLETEEKNVTINVDSMKGLWSDFSKTAEPEPVTAISEADAALIARGLTTVPAGFNPHKKILNILENRVKMAAGQTPLDWGMGEALAFGALLNRGISIRLSGQDAERGTFAHRNAVLLESSTAAKYTPLNHIREGQGKIEILNSPLSEYAVLGFEYGYSLSSPASLTIWEAQFGDFANGAQIIIDQFLSSGEVKWNRMSGLVLLLPHGYEGQGPEHSSARMERFLQLCAKENMIVCNLTTPAQIFHVLMRQALRKQKKPLVILTPKSLLRHPEAVSDMKQITSGKFAEVIDDTAVKKDKVTRAVLCSGKVYYDLVKERVARGIEHIAVIRLEQLYPFKYDQVGQILETYKNLKELFWVQEEPKNMGAWFYVKDRFDDRLAKGKFQNMIQCVARKTSPSPAAGLLKVHEREQKELMDRALA